MDGDAEETAAGAAPAAQVDPREVIAASSLALLQVDSQSGQDDSNTEASKGQSNVKSSRPRVVKRRKGLGLFEGYTFCLTRLSDGMATFRKVKVPSSCYPEAMTMLTRIRETADGRCRMKTLHWSTSR